LPDRNFGDHFQIGLRSIRGALTGQAHEIQMNRSRRTGASLRESAPTVYPCQLCQQEMTLYFEGCPVSTWYLRAIFMADSVASDPPETKNTRFISFGVIPAIFSARSI
jgi:hypothetical protein